MQGLPSAAYLYVPLNFPSHLSSYCLLLYCCFVRPGKLPQEPDSRLSVFVKLDDFSECRRVL